MQKANGLYSKAVKGMQYINIDSIKDDITAKDSKDCAGQSKCLVSC